MDSPVNRGVLKITGLALACSALILFSCLSAAYKPALWDEYSAKDISINFKNGEHADIKYEFISRSFTYPDDLYNRDKNPTRASSHFYLLMKATIKGISGKSRAYTWIAPYHTHSDYYVIVDRLTFCENNAFIQYTMVPSFLTDADPLKLGGSIRDNPRLIVRYARYRGTIPAAFTKGKPLEKHAATYKWPEEYVWEEATKKEFDDAVSSCNVVNERFGDPNYDGWLYNFYSKRAEIDIEQEVFLKAAHDGNRREVYSMLQGSPELIHVRDANGRTILHLAVKSYNLRDLLPALFTFKPNINAIDYRGKTPLHLAIYSFEIDQAIIDRLIEKGGRVLYPECRSREVMTSIKKYRISGNVIKDEVTAEGWNGDDVYQVWMNCTDNCVEGLIRSKGEKRIRTELGLARKADSKITRTMERIFANIDLTCAVKEKKKRHRLVRICAPGLRGLVSEYNEQKAPH